MTALLEISSLCAGYLQGTLLHFHLAFGVAEEIAVMARGVIAHRSDTLAFRRDPAPVHRLLGIE